MGGGFQTRLRDFQSTLELLVAEDPCRSEACLECNEAAEVAARRCLKCAHVPSVSWLPSNQFAIDNGGLCYLWHDRVLANVCGVVLVALLAIVLGGILLQFVIVRCKGDFKAEEDDVPPDEATSATNLLIDGATQPESEDPSVLAKKSDEAISHGLKSWSQRQMRDWTLQEQDGFAPKRFAMCKLDLGTTYVMGVGLPLFYHFNVLVFVSSLITCVAMYAVQHFSGLDDLVADILEEDDINATSSRMIGKPLRSYANTMFWGSGALYLILFVYAMVHCNYQKTFVSWFDKVNSTIADFTIQLKGLPTSIVDEGRLKKLVEAQMQATGEVLGVSIAYDLLQPEVGGRVFEMIENRIVQADVKYWHNGHKLAKQGWGYPASLAKPHQLLEKEDQAEFRTIWDEGKLKGSGVAYVVFRDKAAATFLAQKYCGMWVSNQITPTAGEIDELKQNLSGLFHGYPRDTSSTFYHVIHRSGKQAFAVVMSELWIGGALIKKGTRVFDPEGMAAGQTVTLETHCDVVSNESLDPTSTLWFNHGTPKVSKETQFVKYLMQITTTWGLINLLVFCPIFYFVSMPCGLANISPNPMSAQFQGILFGLAGNILGMVNWNSINAIGYFRTPTLDKAFVSFGTATNLVNSVAFLLIGLCYSLARGFNRVDMSDIASNNVVDFKREDHLFENFYKTLIPGWLFTGAVVGKVMGFVMPIVVNYSLTSIVFVARILPSCVSKMLTTFIPWNPELGWLSARQAEHIFEPPSAALAWEYAGYIITPVICNLALFVMSPHVWHVFALMAFWVAFMYFSHRFATLVLSKKQPLHDEVENLAEKLWGIPLSIILAACGFWGVRAEWLGSNDHHSSFWIVLFFFVIGVLFYLLVLEWVCGGDKKSVFESDDMPYQEVQVKSRYSWFNTNPVHVLKSAYYPEALGEEREDIMCTVPFEFGKEYLQVFNEAAAELPADGKAAEKGAGWLRNFWGGCAAGSPALQVEQVREVDLAAGNERPPQA